MRRLIRCSAVCILVFAFACKQKPKAPPPVVEEKPATTDTLQVAAEDTGLTAYAPVDISPMDMSYFPVEYPKLKMADEKTPPPVARVIYSRPHLQKRRLFANILKFDEPWRLGANEATEIDFFKPVTIQGTKVQAGRYILYCVPHADKWTIVLNTGIDTWGLKQDSTKDVHRFDIPITINNHILEYFTLLFEKTDRGAALVMAWDDVVARLPFSF